MRARAGAGDGGGGEGGGGERAVQQGQGRRGQGVPGAGDAAPRRRTASIAAAGDAVVHTMFVTLRLVACVALALINFIVSYP